MPRSALSVGAGGSPGTVTLVVEGEIDLASHAQLDRALGEAARMEPEVIAVDFAGVDFIDASGLRVLIRAQQRAEREGRRLILRRLQPQIQRLLALSGLSPLFGVERSPGAENDASFESKDVTAAPVDWERRQLNRHGYR